LYQFYFKLVTPAVGKVLSKDSAAYTYLPDSVKAFPDGEDFISILAELGYKNTSCKALTFGIRSLYSGVK